MAISTVCWFWTLLTLAINCLIDPATKRPEYKIYSFIFILTLYNLSKEFEIVLKINKSIEYILIITISIRITFMISVPATGCMRQFTCIFI